MSPSLLSHITTLYIQLAGMRPFTHEALRTIKEKFRIEYNYHSNHLEGNWLTFWETRSLLFFGVVWGTTKKQRRDYEEMKLHDKLVSELGLLDRLEFVGDIIDTNKTFSLTQSDIRSLHHMMLWSDYEKRVYNPETNEYLTEKVSVWAYKQHQNHVKQRDWSLFRFAEPIDTPWLMSEFVHWLHISITESTLHPVEIAALCHYKFIRIHPFSDGNGRIARILMNIVLMHYHYPPIVVSSDQISKEGYYTALEQTDRIIPSLDRVMKSNDPSLHNYLIEYIGWELQTALQWMIDAAEWKEILDSHSLSV